MLFEQLDLYLDSLPHEGALNMALDEAMARSTSRPSLRVYRWRRPSVSFGYFGRHREVAVRWPGRDLVRRWTGGGEVPHGEDFTYTLAVPADHPFARAAVRDSYQALHAALAPLLPGARLATHDEGDAPACFTHPVVADIMIATQKVAGAAQRRGTFGLLHQGSIQGTRWPEDLAVRLAHHLATEVRIFDELPLAWRATADSLAAEKYATPAWLTRR